MDDHTLHSTSNGTKRTASGDLETPRGKRTQFGIKRELGESMENTGAVMNAVYNGEHATNAASDTERNLRNSNAKLQQEKRDLERRLLTQHDMNESLKAQIVHLTDANGPPNYQLLGRRPVQQSELDSQQLVGSQSEADTSPQQNGRVVELKQQIEKLLLNKKQLENAYLSCNAQCTSLKATVERLKMAAQQAEEREFMLQSELEKKTEEVRSFIELDNNTTRHSQYQVEQTGSAWQDDHQHSQAEEAWQEFDNVKMLAKTRGREIRRSQETVAKMRMVNKELTRKLSTAQGESRAAKKALAELEQGLTNDEIVSSQRVDANRTEIKILRTHNEQLTADKRTLEDNARKMQHEIATLENDLTEQKRLTKDTSSTNRSKQTSDDAKRIKELLRSKKELKAQLRQRTLSLAAAPHPISSTLLKTAQKQATKATKAAETANSLLAKMYSHYDTAQVNNSVMVARLEAQAITMGLRDRRSSFRRDLDAMKALPLTELDAYREL